MIWESGDEWAACPDLDGIARQAWSKNLNCPETSAVGRLFDAAAALILNKTCVSFEAEGPMLLESMCSDSAPAVSLPLDKDVQGILRADWQSLMLQMADGRRSPGLRAEIFHSTMARLVLEQAQAVRDEHGVNAVGLGGGVFQNRVLTGQAISLLRSDGFEVRMPTRLPVNDAGLSFGQAAELAAREN